MHLAFFSRFGGAAPRHPSRTSTQSHQAPTPRTVASQCDELHTLPPDIVEEVRAAGIVRMDMPKTWGRRAG